MSDFSGNNTVRRGLFSDTFGPGHLTGTAINRPVCSSLHNPKSADFDQQDRDVNCQAGAVWCYSFFMKVLISGAGIAGPTLAYWLNQYGIEVTIVENAPRLRTGGYVIDFWGAGFEVADRMGLVPQLMEKGYLIREVRIVDERGRRVAGFPAEVFGRVTQGRYVSLPRGDLAAAIFRKVERKVEAIFGDSVAAIEPTSEGVRVGFERRGAQL